MNTSTNKKRVCIIGAGPRGLVTARHLSNVQDLEVVVFESKDDVGGIWYYKEMNAADSRFEEHKKTDNYFKLHNCFSGSMYETLTTNLPYFYMEYKDLAMMDVDENFPQFLKVSDYKKYLDAYAAKFDLKKMIKFQTLVKSVRLYKNLTEEEKSKAQDPRKFLVTTIDSEGHSLTVNEKHYDFDYIVVTSGQYSLPYIPEIPNIENFKGNILHCKDFRTPNSEIFKKKKILVVGGGFSAQDMLLQFFSKDNHQREEDCEKLIVCSTRVAHIKEAEDFAPFIANGKLSFHQGRVAKIKEPNIACFSDGSEEEIDTILYATGYSFKFPFFDYEKDKIITHDEKEHRGAFFGPVYKKLIAIREPEVFFVGYLEMTLLVHIVPELQALVVKYLIEGKLKVPSKEEMEKSFNEEVEEHMRHVGDLAHFYKTNLTGPFPNMKNSDEMNEWIFLRDWLKEAHENNDEEKGKKFEEFLLEVRREIFRYWGKGNFLRFKKENYLAWYPKEFRNTLDFV